MPVPATGPLWTKNFIALSFSNALLFSGFHLLVPVLPVFIADHGGNDAQIGLIMGSFTFSAILIRLFTEAGIRRLGKVPFLLLGMFVCLLATAAYYWADSVGLALAVRLLHGLGFGIATTMYATLVADIIPGARRGEGMGYFGLGTTVMMAAAPAFGVWLVAGYGFGVLFAVATAGQIVAVLGMGFFSPGAPGPAKNPGQGAALSFLDRVIERQAAFPALLSLLTGICVGGVLSFVTLLAKQANLATVGYFFLVATSFIFLSRLVIGRIFDRKGPAWVILPGAVSLLIGQLILSQVGTTAVLLTAAVFHGLGIGILFPSLQTWMISIVASDRRSAVNATFYNFIDSGIGGGSVLLGFVAGAGGYSAVYLTSAAVMGAFIAVYIAYLVKRGR